jgi:ribose 5-phosphate isomerase B
MKVGVAADHGGFDLKRSLVQTLRGGGHEVVDFGAKRQIPHDDYPDYVIPLAQAVASGEVERGIAVCASGVGACIAANRIRGVRAALITEVFSAHQGVEDDNMNLICLGGRVVGFGLAVELVGRFLAAKFSEGERHKRRLAKISALENRDTGTQT